jgi:hypothetical protein
MAAQVNFEIKDGSMAGPPGKQDMVDGPVVIIAQQPQQGQPVYVQQPQQPMYAQQGYPQQGYPVQQQPQYGQPVYVQQQPPAYPGNQQMMR